MPVRLNRRRIVCLCAVLAGIAAGLAIGLAAHGAPGRVPAATRGVPVPPGISSCAIPAWVHADGKVLASGSCAGNFLMSAPAVTVRAGQQIEVQMLQEEAIPGSLRVLVRPIRFRAAQTAGSWSAPLPAPRRPRRPSPRCTQAAPRW